MDYLDHFVIGAEWFGDHLAHAHGSRQVPIHPEWTVRDLALHLGNQHLWAASIIETGKRTDPFGDKPTHRSARRIAAWYRARAEDLYAVLRDTPWDQRCWTLGDNHVETGTVSFWARRQALEQLVHGIDLASALDVAPRMPEDLAIDGIAEVLTVLLPRVARLHPPDLTHPVEVRVRGTRHRWLVRPGAGRTPEGLPTQVRGDPRMDRWADAGAGLPTEIPSQPGVLPLPVQAGFQHNQPPEGSDDELPNTDASEAEADKTDDDDSHDSRNSTSDTDSHADSDGAGDEVDNEAGGTLEVTLGADGTRLERRPDVLEASADVLLMLLWKRARPQDVTVRMTGDSVNLHGLLASRLTF